MENAGEQQPTTPIIGKRAKHPVNIEPDDSKRLRYSLGYDPTLVTKPPKRPSKRPRRRPSVTEDVRFLSARIQTLIN